MFAYSTATQTQPLDDTLLPQHGYAAALDPLTGAATASGLSQEGYHIRYGSNWMMVVGFNEDGPQARGLLVASQSNNPQSPHWNDQTQDYATEQQLRPLKFTETEIAAATLTDITIELSR
ncbi:MAG: penicillin acylase family protein [Ferrimonas sp.]